MEDPRLPHNPREGIIFGTIVTAISCLIIGGANVYLSVSSEIFVKSFLTSYPFIFLFAFVVSSFIVENIARRVVARFYRPGDSVNSMICYNLIIFVLMMSAIMSVLGPFAGQIAGFLFTGSAFDIAYLFENWPNIWPRNFCIAFWTEMLIAQPVARRVMVRIHSADSSDAASDIGDQRVDNL